jgi:hypothetical protein
MKRLAAGLAASVIVIGMSAPVLGHSPNPIFSGGLFDPNQVLQYRWASAGTPPYDMKVAINAARDDSNASRKSKAPVFEFNSGATNVVYYGPDVPCGVNGLACFRRDAPDWFGIWFRPNGHRFDWGTLRWCEIAGAPDGCYEAENVMLDELGHVLVLDHHENFASDSDYGDAVVQTYSRTKPKAFWNAHAYGRCDVASLQQQYDVATWTTPYSTCLDVPTTLTASASATTVPSGSMVTFSATLRSAGSGKLSSNPMSGRIVVLQRRTSSGWSDVATMSPGSASGTYATSVTIRATQDYRALFRKPSGEGVRTDTSPTIAIKVTTTCTSGPCPQSAPAVTR